MFYYIDQPRTPSFPIGLVKTESDFVIRLVETDLGRWMLVVVVISVDAYPFLAFPDLTCHLEDTRISLVIKETCACTTVVHANLENHILPAQ